MARFLNDIITNDIIIFTFTQLIVLIFFVATGYVGGVA